MIMEEIFLQALELQNNLLMASRLAHWNVIGPNFYQYHLLFERIYSSVSDNVDTLAEQARGIKIEIRASVFNSVPEIDWSTPVELCVKLRALNSEFRGSLERLREEADESGLHGLVNVIEDILSDCNSTEYLLGSVIGDL